MKILKITFFICVALAAAVEIDRAVQRPKPRTNTVVRAAKDQAVPTYTF